MKPPAPVVVPRSRRTKRREPILSRPPVLLSTLTLSYVRVGDVTRAIASSSLAGVVFYVWYLDGSWIGTTTSPTRDLRLRAGESAWLEVLATVDPAFDPILGAPVGYPSTRSLWWVRSLDVDVDHYLVEQQEAAGPWVVVGSVPQTPGAWSFGWTSGRLDDLASYAWRVTPVDGIGNVGTARTFAAEVVVRRPDPPSFTVAVAAGLVTFGAP